VQPVIVRHVAAGVGDARALPVQIDHDAEGRLRFGIAVRDTFLREDLVGQADGRLR
jgi:hypothetical protein